MKQNLAFIFLLVIGLSQLTGDLLKIPALKAIGAATGASPAPKVFTAHKGFETYSSKFYIDWADKYGKKHSLHLTPSVYKNIKGPYNRRNTYGAIFSYAPVLSSTPYTKAMFEGASYYAICGENSILSELGINKDDIISPVVIRLVPRQKLPENHGWQLDYRIDCDA